MTTPRDAALPPAAGPPATPPGFPRQAAPPAGPPPARSAMREGGPVGPDRGVVDAPWDAPRREREAPPWQSHEQAPVRQPEWRTALGRGRETAQPRDRSAYGPAPEPTGAEGGHGRPISGNTGGTTSAGTGEEPPVSREAIRAAIRGQGVPKGAIPRLGDPGDRGDRLVLPGPTGETPGARRASAFPSEEKLLKQPPRWRRMLRRLPVAVPGEGQLRKAPSVRDRERKRALLRFGILVVVIVLIGGGLWIASMRGGSSEADGTGVAAPAPTLVRVQPSGVTASTQSGSRVADNVIDGKPGTFWSRLVPSDDDRPYLRFSFDRPVQLGRLTIAAGASGTEFAKRPRPQEIELRFSDGTTLRTTLADKSGFQTVSFKPREVDRVRLVVLSTYPSPGQQRTSISEVRFFAVKR